MIGEYYVFLRKIMETLITSICAVTVDVLDTGIRSITRFASCECLIRVCGRRSSRIRVSSGASWTTSESWSVVRVCTRASYNSVSF